MGTVHEKAQKYGLKYDLEDTKQHTQKSILATFEDFNVILTASFQKIRIELTWE